MPLGQNLQSQNLINAVPVGKIERPPGFYKSFILEALSIALALFAGYFYRQYLSLGTGLIPGLLCLLGLALISPMLMLLTKSTGRRALVLVLEIIAFLVFFYSGEIVFLVSTGAAAFMFMFWGEAVGRRQAGNSLTLHFFQVCGPLLSRLVTAFALMFILLYLPQWKAEESFLSSPSFNELYNVSIKFVKQFVPEWKLDSTFEDFAKSFTRAQLQGNFTFLQLLPAAQDKAINDNAAKVMEDLGQSLGIELSPKQPLSLVFYNFCIRLLENWKEKFGNQFLFAWAVVFFFVLRGFGGIFLWIASGLGYFLFQLLIATGFIRLVGESRMHEVVEFS